jgi:phosphatidate cytidylyltransferase
MNSNLLQRIAVAAVAIPAILAVLYVGGWPLALLLAFLGVIGTWEMFELARRQGIRPLAVPGLLGAAAIPLAGYMVLERSVNGVTCLYCGKPLDPLLAPLAALWLMSVFGVALRIRSPQDRPLAAIGVTILAPLYASGLLSMLYVLRYGPVAALRSPGGLWFAAAPLVITWIGDTAAMAAGTLIGGPKLAPVLSPNKTWAGAVAGTVAAVATAVVLGNIPLRGFSPPMTAPELVALGLVVSLAGQVGDVGESLLKREVGVKDSSALIPGHGGVLDRLDSLYFAIPATALLYTVLQL